MQSRTMNASPALSSREERALLSRLELMHKSEKEKEAKAEREQNDWRKKKVRTHAHLCLQSTIRELDAVCRRLPARDGSETCKHRSHPFLSSDPAKKSSRIRWRTSSRSRKQVLGTVLAKSFPLPVSAQLWLSTARISQQGW